MDFWSCRLIHSIISYRMFIPRQVDKLVYSSCPYVVIGIAVYLTVIMFAKVWVFWSLDLDKFAAFILCSWVLLLLNQVHAVFISFYTGMGDSLDHECSSLVAKTINISQNLQLQKHLLRMLKTSLHKCAVQTGLCTYNRCDITAVAFLTNLLAV